jgi:uroporphyrinogen decarboxylase
MNSFERIQCALEGKKPDRVPVMLHNFLMAAHELGINMKAYRNSPRMIADSFIHAVEKYGYDGIVVDVDTVTLAAAAGVPTDYPDEEPARLKGRLLDDIEDVINLGPVEVSKNERVNIWVQACRLLVEHFGNEVFIRGNCDQAPFSLAGMVRGMEGWLFDLIDESKRENVYKLLDHCYLVCSEFMTLVSDTGVHMVSNGDSIAGPDMISPELYRNFAKPYEKKMAQHAHELDKPYLLHICGKTDYILDDMIETGANVLELDYKTDINLINKKCSPKLVFCGNIDPSGVLAMGTEAKVREKTRELLNIYSKENKFILNAGCAIPSNTPEVNLMAMIDEARK